MAVVGRREEMLAGGVEDDICRTSFINFDGGVCRAVFIDILGHDSNVLCSINEVENCKRKPLV